jgi:Mg2+ and Co2+ transporter CorA
MLNDQMGLITLLSQELPDISRRTEAIVDLAFNVSKTFRAMAYFIDIITTQTLAFNTNNLLQILAFITIASLPLTVATGVLGINYFDSNHITGTT